MAEPNPYQTPSQTSDLPVCFDPNRLPLVYRISMDWFFYWSGMLILSTISLVLALASQFQFPTEASVLSIIAPLPPAFMIWLCLQSLLSRIEISNSGIRIHQFGQLIQWSDIQSWRIGRCNAPTLTLKNGNEFRVFGPATSVSRNEVICEALTHFVGTDAPENAG